MKRLNQFSKFSAIGKALFSPILTELRSFLTSIYFRPLFLFSGSIFISFMFAIYPFHDLSLNYMSRPSIVSVTLETAIFVLFLSTWVLAVSHKLDQFLDWEKYWGRRLWLQFVFTLLVPMFFWLLFVVVFYGREAFVTNNMQFVYALCLVFVLLINLLSYLIYLYNVVVVGKLAQQKLHESIRSVADELAQVKEMSTASEEKYNASSREALMNRERIADLKNKLKSAQKDVAKKAHVAEKAKMRILELSGVLTRNKIFISALEREVQILKGDLGESELSPDPERLVDCYKITNSFNKKPIISVIYSDSSSEVVAGASSLAELLRENPDMIQIGPRYLVGAHTILSVKAGPKSSKWVKLLFQDDPISVTWERWAKIAPQVETIIKQNEEAYRASLRDK